IKKPPGEPGRPNSGGFNVEKAMKWSKEDFTKIQTFVSSECDKTLDTDFSMANQEEEDLKRICKSACDMFPALRRFEDDWPARSLMKLYLKKTSEQARRSK
ncbi:hypothetical protein FA15DRAFT_549499, partial [Coprinopsis marcescibilis]